MSRQYTVEYVELETGNYFVELKNHHLPIKENLSKHLNDGIFE
jgi:hypothetical protein